VQCNEGSSIIYNGTGCSIVERVKYTHICLLHVLDNTFCTLVSTMNKQQPPAKDADTGQGPKDKEAWAVLQNQDDILKSLMNKAGINFMTTESDNNNIINNNSSNDTGCPESVCMAREADIEMILAKYADLQVEDCNINVETVIEGNVDVVSMLIDQPSYDKANNKQDNHGKAAPVLCAMSNNEIEVVRMLPILEKDIKTTESSLQDTEKCDGFTKASLMKNIGERNTASLNADSITLLHKTKNSLFKNRSLDEKVLERLRSFTKPIYSRTSDLAERN
jgi:hypothetical protein